MGTILRIIRGTGAGSEVLKVFRLGSRLFRVLSRRAPYSRVLELHEGGLPQPGKKAPSVP